MLNSTDEIIEHKASFLKLAEYLCNVSKDCQVRRLTDYFAEMLQSARAGQRTIKLYIFELIWKIWLRR